MSALCVVIAGRPLLILKSKDITLKIVSFSNVQFLKSWLNSGNCCDHSSVMMFRWKVSTVCILAICRVTLGIGQNYNTDQCKRQLQHTKCFPEVLFIAWLLHWIPLIRPFTTWTGTIGSKCPFPIFRAVISQSLLWMYFITCSLNDLI